jgi:retron-type reverse transcriptase
LLMCELHGLQQALPFIADCISNKHEHKTLGNFEFGFKSKASNAGRPSFFLMTKQANSMHPQNRSDLAAYLDIPLKLLTYCLYAMSRESAYTKKGLRKSSGGVRAIHAVSEPLRGLQRTALDRLQGDFKPSAYAHGFSQDKSILTNAYVHQRSKMVLRVDVKDFFPSINFGRVRGMFLGPPFKFGEQAATAMAQMSCLAGSEDTLPQGGVLSPYVANMLCRRLDARLAGLAKIWKCRFTRYADDCIFSTNDLKNFNAEKFTALIISIFEEEGFQINDDKTRIMYPNDRQMVTGIVVNDGININRRYYRSLRALLHNWKSYGISSQLVKKGGFKDERNPGPRFARDGDVFRLNGQEFCKEHAEKKFARHVLGRILFLLQATNFVPPFTEGYLAREKPESAERIAKKRRETLAERPRSQAAQKLLLEYYHLVSKPKHLIELKKAAYKQLQRYPIREYIARHPHIKTELSTGKSRYKIREQALEDYRERDETKDRLYQINHFSDMNDAKELLTELERTDIRFAGLVETDYKALVNKMADLAQYPSFDTDSARSFFASLRDSETGFGQILHHTRRSMNDMNEVMSKVVDPIYWRLPFDLRNDLDKVDDLLEKVSRQLGPNEKIDWIADELTKRETSELKQKTRFHGKEGTPLHEAVSLIVNRVKKEHSGELSEICNDLKDRNVAYAHVPSVLSALEDIIRSMMTHSDGSQVRISQENKDENGKLDFLLKIESIGAVHQIPEPASRLFTHGKLSTVAKRLNGLATYHCEACFIDGQCRVDMLGDVVERIDMPEGVSFRHLIALPQTWTTKA